MATIEVMEAHFDVLRRDRRRAAATSTQLPDDWKQGDGAALACMTIDQNTIKQRRPPATATIFRAAPVAADHEVRRRNDPSQECAGASDDRDSAVRV